jgi:hypothetical protein
MAGCGAAESRALIQDFKVMEELGRDAGAEAPHHFGCLFRRE